jgi:hypothetical protein
MHCCLCPLCFIVIVLELVGFVGCQQCDKNASGHLCQECQNWTFLFGSILGAINKLILALFGDFDLQKFLLSLRASREVVVFLDLFLPFHPLDCGV